jgi:cell division protein FtsW (lipid II flippase)
MIILFIFNLILWIALSLILLAIFNWKRPVLSIVLMILVASTIVSGLQSYKVLTGMPRTEPLPELFYLYAYHLDEPNNAIDLWLREPEEVEIRSYRITWNRETAENLQEADAKYAISSSSLEGGGMGTEFSLENDENGGYDFVAEVPELPQKGE